MRVPTDFWLVLHNLAGCVEAEGESRDDRLANIVTAWQQMSPMARDTVAQELGYLLEELPQIRALLHDGENGDTQPIA